MKVWNKHGLLAMTSSDGGLYTIVDEDHTTYSQKDNTMLILPDDTDNPEELAGKWELVATFNL